jgi:hypothetical protein
MCLKNVLFVTLLLFIVSTTTAQRNYDDYNLLGIQAGVTFFDINTSDLVTEQQNGFAAGFTTRGSFRNSFDLIYGLTFLSTNIGVWGGPLTTSPSDKEFIKYNIPNAQLNFQGSLNIVKKHLSIEFGPILNVNGKMKLDNENFENYLIDGYTTVRAQDITDISTINVRLMGGLTTGIENFRITANYQYGVTNILKKLNDQNLEKTDFEGHSGTIVVMGLFYF